MATESTDEERSPFTTPRFIASAALIALLVVALVFLFVTRDSGDKNTDASSAPTAEVTVTQAASATPTSDSVCGMAAGSQEVPTAPLGTNSLTVATNLTVPDIEGAGPGITKGITRCFAHSPKGAVVAAANFMRWFSSKQQLDEVAETLLASGSDRDRMVVNIKAEWDGSTNSPFSIEGYKVAVRSKNEVLVTLAVAPTTDLTRMSSWPLVMVWEDGDWKVQVPSNDDWGETAISNMSAEGFVPWPF